jgi:glucokinase
MTLLVAADIGGTNARFALAEVAGGRVVSLGEPVVLPAAGHTGLASAWQAFGKAIGKPLPRHAAIAVAGPVTGGAVRFVNSHWVVDPATLGSDLELEDFTLLNDFGAMAHAVHALGPEHFSHLCGPDIALPESGAISVIGPGTGLGVAVLQRTTRGPVVLDADERRICDALTARHRRVSLERVVSGPGLGEIVRTFAPGDTRSDGELWADAVAGREDRALALFLAAFGSAAGDLSLAHGALGIAITGGLANRLGAHFSASPFHTRFCDKGRYAARMEGIPIKVVTHPQPGLFGAAAAFALEHMQEMVR